MEHERNAEYFQQLPRGSDVAFRRRLARVLWMLALLREEPERYTRKDLARITGLSEPQIDLDLRACRDVGYTIKRSKRGYWIDEGPTRAELEAHFELPTEEERG